MTFDVFDILAIAINFLNLVFLVFVLFFERKEPTSRLAWILILMVLPGIGIFLYIVLSGNFFTSTKKMDRIRRYIQTESKEFLEEQREFYQKNKNNFQNRLLVDYEDLISMNLNHFSNGIAFTESVEVFCWGKDMFEKLCEDLERAEKSIYMEFFIFKKDNIGRRIMEILCRKARQGVDVRLLYDDLGSLLQPARFFLQLDRAGGATNPFYPIRFGAPVLVNYRNHHKNVIIDGKIGYMGGMNVGDEYIVGLHCNKDIPWRDTHLRLTGSVVHSLALTFYVDWYGTAIGRKSMGNAEKLAKLIPMSEVEKLNKKILDELKNDVPGDERIPTQLITSAPNNQSRREIHDFMVRMVMDAKESVYIQTPYFTPDEPFFDMLKVAALSGKDVRVIVPEHWDKPYVKAAAFEYIRDMMGFGVKFYAYPGFIHSKMLMIDRRIMTLGTTNIDTRSFDLHFEMNLVFYDEPFTQKYCRIFMEDQSRSKLMEKDKLDNAFILRRTLWSFCKLFAPLM